MRFPIESLIKVSHRVTEFQRFQIDTFLNRILNESELSERAAALSAALSAAPSAALRFLDHSTAVLDI